MDDFIRFKRKNGNVYRWPTKLYIPVPLTTKNQFATVSRLHCLSQAELGCIIVMHYLANQKLSELAIEQYKQAEERLRTEFLEKRTADDEARVNDRTFGGLFKSSFPESDDDE